MLHPRFLAAVIAAVPLVLLVPASAATGGWGNALQVPGTAQLGTVGAFVSSVSCPAAGDCVAGGWYDTPTNNFPFVSSEVNGIWQKAITIRGVTITQSGGLGSLSCPAVGYCMAGISADSSVMVASEVHGIWGKAIQLPGFSTLNHGFGFSLNSLSCGAPGYCAIGGYYQDKAGGQQAFIASQVNGVWHSAIQVPGTAALNTGANASVQALSCRSTGDCTAVGYYVAGGRSQAFVISAVNGVWRSAIQEPGIAALDAGRNSETYSVSCGSRGNCALGGFYDDASRAQAYVADQVNGVWRSPVEIPGIAALNTRGPAWTLTTSCASAGNCVAGGAYEANPANPTREAFVASSVNGVWRKAIEVPGIGALNTYGDAEIVTASCGSPGYCSAGGYYTDAQQVQHGFLVDEVNGIWQRAIVVPGLAPAAASMVNSVSCGAPGECAAGGYYEPSFPNAHAFVVSRS